MSRHITVSLLRNYNCKMHPIYSCSKLTHCVSTSLPNISSIHRLLSSSVSDNKQVSKVVQPPYKSPIEDVLSCIDEAAISGSESVSVLKVLRLHTLFKGTSSDSFRNDSRFKYLCETFERDCSKLNPNQLVSGLRSLLEVGVSPDSSCVMSAEENVLETIDKFSALNLIGCLYYHHKFTETPLQKKVVSELMLQLVKKQHEISSPAEILMLVHILHLFDKKSKNELELVVTQLVKLLSVSEMCKLICSLAETSNRSLPILNAVAFYMQLSRKEPKIKETIDIFYAFKKLNFFDPKLFEYLLNHFGEEIPFMKQATMITGLLTACGHMRWRHTDILDKCGEWITNNISACKLKDLVSYVLTVASLNYSSSEVGKVLEKILPHILNEQNISPDVLLNVAWSLGVLDNLPKELLLKVLSSEFYQPLISNPDLPAKMSNQLKLLNLKGILREKYPDHVFGCSLYLEPMKLPESTVIESCRQHVVKVLSTLAPKEKYLYLNQVSDTGVFIDVEFIINNDAKPLPLKEYGTLSKTKKPLPKLCKRIAGIIMFQKDFTHWSQQLTGINALAIRLLRFAGYTVLIIPYDEFSAEKTEVQKLKYLSDKLKHCVKTSA